MMKLVITTPFAVAIEENDVAALQAEDGTGRFGILPDHADLLAALVPSVISWQRGDGVMRYCAVHGGILTMADGNAISVSSRDAVPGDDLETLETEVVARFTRRRSEEETARIATERMILAALRQIIAFIRPDRAPRP